ncbi:Type II and III secretion system protein [Magnetospirillum gryphiswaldense MSR-1 v2]|uniref:Type II and III secretion system protein n=1 Tax=Magnetospirillum gryphiswaldense (strain DSM 6361 / JCM 21280 / NBRC 15271 / MSR-1) TaxID=431944 RepID=V6F044_MAGGM|nr:type II and III secretion system protein family protein [Magnetospirillum gryphiswaldense]CDK98824.1 Type II and III secretion system protein [Magnetospirillum gryphiswaldense MSR-1 v2]
MIRLIAILALLAMPALAQEPPLPQPAPVLGKVSSQPLNRPVTRGLPLSAETQRMALHKTREIILTQPMRDVVVGNPDVVDVMVKTPTQAFLVGRGIGQSDVTFFSSSGAVLHRVSVDVHLDADGLQTVLEQLMPEERHVRVAGIGDALYLSGSVGSDAAAMQIRTLARRYVKDDAGIVNLLKVSSESQVLLQVKVAEMQKTVLKELGVGLSGKAFGIDGVAGTLATTATTGLTQSTALFGSLTVSGLGSLVSTLSGLERQGLIRTLVEPNLTAVSGETANLLAGGEFPIPVSENNGQVTIEFKQFGVLLNFTPVVMDPGRISLKLQTEVSAIDKITAPVKLNNFEIPGLTVRRASSTVEMSSGGSIMIAGLLQNDITATLSGMPGAMDIPILGTLFRSNSFQRKETELVVIVSAFVVQPLEKPQMALPSDGFAPSSDMDRILLGRLQERYVKNVPPPAVPPKLQGPHGFMVR